MDVLTDVLRTVRMRNVLHGRLELTAPWGARLEAIGHPFFYVISRGACWFEVEGIVDPFRIDGGDFVLLTRGQAHVARDAPRTRAIPLTRILETRPKDGTDLLTYGGGGALTSMVCGHFVLEAGGWNPLLESLPPVIHVRGEDVAAVQWLDATLRFVTSEAAAGRPGSTAVLSCLADILFIQAARAHLTRPGNGAPNWLRALVDPQIGRALVLLHERLAFPWTVEGLAASVSMSRSAFAARFAQLVGEPPLQYLTRWRMQKASAFLSEGEARLAEVAQKVGYAGEAALSRAFKRWVGIAPGVYRKSRRGEALDPGGSATGVDRTSRDNILA